MLRSRFHILPYAALFASALGLAAGPEDQEGRAREDLAQRLLRLSQSLDMKEAKYEESKSGGKSYDANTGNSFVSNTTIHYNVESTCRAWLGGSSDICEQWLDPFISPHGFGGDFSPLEGAVAGSWKQSQLVDSGNQYRIWDVTREGGGANTDADGKFDRSGITDWRINAQVAQKLETVGEQTAIRQMSLTFDDNAPKNGNTMPNMEGLRMMASRWTKMFRNRLVANLAEMRASDKPTEFLLDEEKPDCEAYARAMQREQEETRVEERLNYQGKLDPETSLLALEQRYKACVAMRSASVNAVNPEVVGDQVSEGNPDSERFDKWRTRLNIAAIDRVGIDVNNLPRPKSQVVSRIDQTSKMAQWELGGQKMRGRKRMTNAEQLNSYNNNLELAAVGMQEVAMRSGNIVDNSDFIKKHKIKNGDYNAVRLNSITGEMRRELASTSMKQSSVMKGNPELKLEDNATQLAITRR
jgi:hypothetical protein